MSVINDIEKKYKKAHVVDVVSGDTVRVHQKIREGNKERIQVFEGLVIRATRKNSHTSRISVRRISSGVGVEKTYLIHSPLVVKVEVTKRGKVRRNYLSYMRERTGKSARLSNITFDQDAVNKISELPKEEKNDTNESTKENKQEEKIESKIEEKAMTKDAKKSAEEPKTEPLATEKVEAKEEIKSAE